MKISYNLFILVLIFGTASLFVFHIINEYETRANEKSRLNNLHKHIQSVKNATQDPSINTNLFNIKDAGLTEEMTETPRTLTNTFDVNTIFEPMNTTMPPSTYIPVKEGMSRSETLGVTSQPETVDVISQPETVDVISQPETVDGISHSETVDVKLSEHGPVTVGLLTGDVLIPKVRQEMKGRYLFPVVNFNGGPNFQYRQLKIAIQMAIDTRRTIVLTDFRHHRSQESSGRVHFNQTFDLDVFQEFMPTLSIEEFVEKCGRDIRDVLTNPFVRHNTIGDSVSKYLTQRTWLKRRAEISIPPAEDFPRSLSECQDRMRKLDKSPCVVMTTPVDFERAEFPQKEEIYEAVNKHLVRAPFLRQAVAKVMAKLCDGKSILGLHWRNKTGEMCRVGHLRHGGDPRCDGLLEIQIKLIQKIAHQLKIIIKQHHIDCVFVAYAPDEPQNIIRLLTDDIPNLITMSDVINVHGSDLAMYNGDDYFQSLIEQEICTTSDVFVGNSRSNWSRFLYQERRAHGKRITYDMIEDFPNMAAFGEYL